MNIYDLGRKYINSIPLETDLNEDEVIFEVRIGEKIIYSLEYRGYNGLMAIADKYNTYDKRPKLGYFDFRIRDSIKNTITHRNLLENILTNSTLQNCYRVWQGDNVENIASSEQEMIVLIGFALCMLEQDINWGRNSWQKFTHFGNRGRDMIMGFVNFAFNEGIENIPHWIRGSTPTFGYNLKPGTENFRQYFIFEQNPQPILSGDTLRAFNRKIEMKNNHHNWNEKQA